MTLTQTPSAFFDFANQTPVNLAAHISWPGHLVTPEMTDELTVSGVDWNYLHEALATTFSAETAAAILGESTYSKSPSLDAAAMVLSHPEPAAEILLDRIRILVQAVLESRLALDPYGRMEDIALDLYDEEIISKADVLNVTGIAPPDFYSALAERRTGRRTK